MKKIILLISLPVLWGIQIYAQQTGIHWTLNQPETGTKEYIARDYINLEQGFHYEATKSQSFNGKISQTLLFPSTNNMYMTEDGKITTDPTLGAAVGNLTGSFDVTPTGGASYTIPIDCPAGINGMQPQVSLVYNSQAGNGLVGWGWNIAGLSMISRTGRDYYHDGYKSGISWDRHGAISLDGERLYRVQEFGKDSASYQKYGSDAVMRIMGYNIQDGWGPETFKVYLKDGRVMEYGGKNNWAAYYPVELHLASGQRKNLGWALTKITDSNNNFIEYTYTLDSKNAGGGYTSCSNSRISKVTYGNNSGTEEIVGIIEFSYKDGSNISEVKYIGGYSFINYKILSKIEVRDGASTILHTYDFDYESAESKDFLSSFKLTNAQGEFLHPIKFEWNLPSYEIVGEKINFNFPEEKNYDNYGIVANGDVDGDGLTDFIIRYKDGFLNGSGKTFWMLARSKGNGTFNYSAPFETQHYINDQGVFTSPLLLDIDNDGKDEFILLSSGPTPNESPENNYYTNAKLFRYSSDKQDWESTTPSGFLIEISKDIYEKAYPTNKTPEKSLFIIPGDFLGNGEKQLFVFSNDNQVEGFGEYKNPSSRGKVNISHIEAGNKKSRIYLTDINGNGKTELMFINENTTNFYEYDNDSHSFICIYSKTNLFSYKDIIMPGDFNGDGNTDLLVRNTVSNPTATTQQWKIYIADGKGGLNVNDNFKINQYLKYNQTTYRVIIADINEDGKSDILFDDTSNNQLVLLICNNNIFDKYILKDKLSLNLRYTSNITNNAENLQLISLISNFNAYATLKKGKYINKISEITDSYQNKLSINYQSAKNPFPSNINNSLKETETGNFSEGSINALSPNFHIVEKISIKNGNTTYKNLSYTFNEPKIHFQAKGFLGFTEIITKDSILNASNVTKMRINDNFYFLYPYKSTFSIFGNTVQEETRNYTVNSLGNKRYFLRLDSRESKDLLNMTSIKKSYSDYDDSRNPKTIQTDYGDGFTEEQKFNFIKKGSYFHNKPQNSVVTKKASGETDYVRKEEFEYDNKGNLTKHIIDKEDKNQVTTSYSNYDKYGNPKEISVTANESTRKSSMTYTTSGRFTASETNHLGETVSYQYNESRGLLTSRKDRLGTTKYLYDNFGRHTSTVYPDNTEEFSVLRWATGAGIPANAKYYIYSESSGVSPGTTWYDFMEREIRQESFGLNNKKVYVDTRYNTKGQVEKVSEPYFSGEAITWAAEYTYDAYGRESSVTTPMGITTYEYSPLITMVTSPERKVNTSMNSAGQVISEVTNGKEVTFAYYASGLVKSATPQGGKSVTMEYDLQGNRIKITDPDSGEITTQYDGWGQLISQKQKIHNASTTTTTDYTYSDKGLLEKRTRNGDVTSYTYDAYNRLQKVSIAGTDANWDTHAISYTYDNLDRITKISEEMGYSKLLLVSAMEYDSYGRIKKETYPSGYHITNTYDRNGYLVQVNDSKGNLIWKANAGNARGQLTQVTKGNKSTNYAYDKRGFPQLISSAGIIDMEYEFDEKGNLTSRYDKITNNKETAGYDSMNRLTSYRLSKGGTSRFITYNLTTGNISSKTYTAKSMLYGENNAPVHALTSAVYAPESPPTTESIMYTDFKKVSNIIGSNGFWGIQYGVDDQRVMSSYTTLWMRRSITRYYTKNYEEEINSEENIPRKIHYIYGGDGIAAIYIEKAAGSTLYYAYTDYQGSLIALTSTGGIVQERYAYDPWGVRRDPDDWTKKDERGINRIIHRGYTMHEHLDKFGLIDMNGRMYDPVLGMFLSPDPYIQAPSDWLNFNRYSYAFNNPFKYTDPDGEWFVPIIITAAVFAAGNTAAHAIRGDINNIGDGLKYFGQGALTGAILGATWQFSPLVPGIGQGIQTGMKIYGITQLTGLSLGVVSGIGQGVLTGNWDPYKNAYKIMLGNFYLDENRNFLAGVWQGVSRHTWESFQTSLGHSVGHIRNSVGGVDEVHYFGGSTLMNRNDNNDKGKQWGFTLGPFINSKNINIQDDIFWHEFGHTVQSRKWGFAYPFAIALPSVISNKTSSNKSHRNRWYERQASRYGKKYTGKYLPDYIWDESEYPTYY